MESFENLAISKEGGGLEANLTERPNSRAVANLIVSRAEAEILRELLDERGKEFNESLSSFLTQEGVIDTKPVVNIVVESFGTGHRLPSAINEMLREMN